MYLEIEKMLKILYSPIDYIHPTHLSALLLKKNILGYGLINFSLISYYQLNDLPTHWEMDDKITSLILTQWAQLPAAAHLLGGYLLRCELLSDCALLMADPRLLAFISLPIIHQVKTNAVENKVDTLARGAAFILSQIPRLPSALRERLLLSFPAGMILPQLAAVRTPDNLNLLKMAINYANHYK